MDDPTTPADNERDAQREAARHLAAANEQMQRFRNQAKAPATEARLANLERGFKLLTASVGQLAGIVNRLSQAHTATPAPAQASEPPSQDQLVRWVCWLVDRYELDGIIPECWAEHGALVEELDTLRVGWLATIGNNAPGFAALQWHDQLDRALTRIDNGRWRTCTAGHHPSPAPSWTGQHEPTRPPIDLAADRYQPPVAPTITDEPEPPATTSPEAP